jgi:hypothetical protein
MGELLSRVNDHFSYPDIGIAEVRGEMMLDMSVTSFLAELKHVKDSTLSNPLLQENRTSQPKPRMVTSFLMAKCSNFDFDGVTD